MALFNEPELRSLAQRSYTHFTKKYAATKLAESVTESAHKYFNIFLSHCSDDPELIYGLKLKLEQLGYSAYIDWDVERHSKVNKDMLKLLKYRIRRCRCLFFACAESSHSSIWMPWELGYFDGLRPNKVAILPIAKSPGTGDVYKGHDFLSLYPYVAVKDDKTLYIHETKVDYVEFSKWLNP